MDVKKIVTVTWWPLEGSFCLLHVEVAFGCIARFPKVQASIIGDSAFIHYFLVACSHHFPFAQSHPFHVNIQSSGRVLSLLCDPLRITSYIRAVSKGGAYAWDFTPILTAQNTAVLHETARLYGFTSCTMSFFKQYYQYCKCEFISRKVQMNFQCIISKIRTNASLLLIIKLATFFFHLIYLCFPHTVHISYFAFHSPYDS